MLIISIINLFLYSFYCFFSLICDKEITIYLKIYKNIYYLLIIFENSWQYFVVTYYGIYRNINKVN